MKKNLLTIVLLCSCTALIKAQTLYGTTFNGGTNNTGVVNKFIPATKGLTVVKNLESLSSSNPWYTKLIQATDGKLYGMTAGFNLAETSDSGSIFSYNPGDSAFTTLYRFDGSQGNFPTGSLLQANDGKLYGMTSQGGTTNQGVIFSFDPVSLTYAKLWDFSDDYGTSPVGSLIQSKDGKLYGMTAQGGSISSSGVIFSFDPVTAIYTLLRAFVFSDNGGGFDNVNPQGSLLEASDGKLYGLGTLNNGFIFSYDPATAAYAKLKQFDTTHGINPYGSLVQVANGKLYGMTKNGGSNGYGVIFSYALQDTILTKLADFDSTNGSYPYGDLTMASNGKLYGMASEGGTKNAGTVFSFDTIAHTLTAIKNFDSTTGYGPMGSLLQAGDGKLYGMTTFGNAGNKGVIFSLDAGNSIFTDLQFFGSNTTGSHISAGLLVAGNGMLYGMAKSGGKYAGGAIVSYNPNTSVYSVVKDFNGDDGSSPYGSLVQATDGKLYGMTSAGGSYHDGVIFSFDPASLVFAKLFDFNSTNGASPFGSLLQASDGLFYGITSSGGINADGVIFSYDAANNMYTLLYNLDAQNGGGRAYGGLIQASNGNLYGLNYYKFTRVNSGSSLFSFNPVNKIYKIAVDFGNNATDGIRPFGSLVKGADNKLYATMSAGGSNGDGILFSYDPATALSNYNNLHDFNGADGTNPYGNLFLSASGKMYGMTYTGGADNVGSIFSFDPASSAFTHLTDYNGINGANPYWGSAFVEVAEAGPLPVSLLSFTGSNNGHDNQLSWKVTNQQLLHYYQLQRSLDGKVFSPVADINNAGTTSYTYNDYIDASLAQLYYYRLKLVDIDGKFTYSNIVAIKIDAGSPFVILPNPVHNILFVQAKGANEPAIFQVVDGTGRTLKEIKVTLAGTTSFSMDISTLSKGLYYLVLLKNDQAETRKFVKE
ncbi:MAG: choice-of-anchor tandem repeat GloVer-containing protein [Ginsengibacter sp.]